MIGEDTAIVVSLHGEYQKFLKKSLTFSFMRIVTVVFYLLGTQRSRWMKFRKFAQHARVSAIAKLAYATTIQ